MIARLDSTTRRHFNVVGAKTSDLVERREVDFRQYRLNGADLVSMTRHILAYLGGVLTRR